ncbi:S1 family peptidase [Streptomyces sp. H72]
MAHLSARRRVVKTAGLSLTAAFLVMAVATPSAQGGESAPDDTAQAYIIGGTEVPNDAYPFMAALLGPEEGNAWQRQNCGGSLVDQQFVLTAAHCISEPRDAPDIVIGRTVLSNSRQGQVRHSKRVFVHPLYQENKSEDGEAGPYDAALVKLDEPVSDIVPVRLPTTGTDSLIRPGQTATLIGWGTTDTEIEHSPDRLRRVDVPILSHDECETTSTDYDRDVEICAGADGKDSCYGDSGGPLLRAVPGRERYYQIGIVSRGPGCAEQGGPSTYTSTSSAELWDTWKGTPWRPNTP